MVYTIEATALWRIKPRLFTLHPNNDLKTKHPTLGCVK
jgi:hypothetical protein